MLDKKKVIIFDMDGTLIDSVGVWNEIDQELIHRLGGGDESMEVVQKRRDEALTRYKDEKEPYVAYCTYLGQQYHSPLTGQEIHSLRYTIARDFLLHKVDYKEGVPEVLRALQRMGKTLVIATTTRRDNMDIYRTKNTNLLSKAPLDDFFTAIYTKEDAKHIKPDPEIYLTVMKDFGKKPEDCLVFEDSLIGVQAAKAAGIETVAVYDRYSERDQKEIKKLADHWITNFGELSF